MKQNKSNSRVSFYDAMLMVTTAAIFTALVLTPTLFYEVSFLKRVLISELIIIGVSFFRRGAFRQIFISYVQIGIILAIISSLVLNTQLIELKNFFAYLLIMVISLQLIAITSLSIIVSGIALSGVFSILLSVMMVQISPQLSIGPDGQFQGLYGHWNIFGMTLIFSLPALLSIELRNKTLQFIIKISTSALLLVFVLLSKSSTSLISFLVIICVWVVYLLYLKSPRNSVIAGISFLSFVTLSSIFSSFVLSFLGKTVDLTGRVPIWNSAITHLHMKWFSGYGWSPLLPTDSPLYLYIVNDTGIGARHMHNDLLNWLALTGVFGMFSILGFYLISITAGTSLFKKKHQITYIWIPLAAIGLLVQGITEISTITPQGWFITSAVLGILGKQQNGWWKVLYFPFPLHPIKKNIPINSDRDKR